MEILDKDNSICSYKVLMEDDYKAFNVILGVDYPVQYIIRYDTNNRRHPWSWGPSVFDIRCKRYIEDLGLDKEVIKIYYKVLEVEGIHILDDRSISIDDKSKKPSIFDEEITDKLYKKLTGLSTDNVLALSIELGPHCGHLYYSEDNTVKAISSARIVETVLDETGRHHKIYLSTNFDREDNFIRDIIIKYGTVIEWSH